MDRDDALFWLSFFWFVTLCGLAIWMLLSASWQLGITVTVLDCHRNRINSTDGVQNYLVYQFEVAIAENLIAIRLWAVR